MLLLIQILLYLVLLLSNIIHDAILINYYKRSPKHSKNVIVIVLLAWAAYSILLLITADLLYLIPLALYWPVRWLMHDALLNMLRGLPYNYISEYKGQKEYSKIDRWLQKYPNKQYHFKGLLLIIVVVASIILYNLLKNN